MTTKEKIYSEALKLFSINGYKATSVRDIAKAVGIKDSSLYNHYKNKQAIFEYIIEIHEQESDKEFIEFCKKNDCTNTDILLESAIAILMAYIEPCVVQVRKMLIMEIYHNQYAKETYYNLFYQEPYRWCEVVFGKLIKAGVMREESIESMYYEFYGSIFMLILESDFHPISMNEIINKVTKHANEFTKQYSKNYNYQLDKREKE